MFHQSQTLSAPRSGRSFHRDGKGPEPMKSLLEPSLSGRISQPSIVFPCVLRFVSGYWRFDLYLHTYLYIYICIYIYIYDFWALFSRTIACILIIFRASSANDVWCIYKYTVTIVAFWGNIFLMTTHDKSGTVSDRSMLLGNLCETLNL